MDLFLLWLRALRDNALPHTTLMYACLVPGFPHPAKDGQRLTLELLITAPFNEDCK